MRVGVAQIHTRAGDLAGAAERIAAQAASAAARGVDLLVFPHATLTGPTGVPPQFQDEFALDASRTLATLAMDLACPCLVPLARDVGGLPTCDVMLLADGRSTLLRSRARGADVTNPVTFAHAGLMIDVVFSYDTLMDLVDTGVASDLVIYLSDLEFAIDNPACALGAAAPAWAPVLPMDAHACLVAAGSVGGYGSRVYLGASYIAAPDATLLAVAPPFEEDLIVADIGTAATADRVSRIPYDERSFLWQSLVLGTRDYLAALGATDVVIALDGTLTSSVLAVVASDALGPTHVHVLVVPSNDDAFYPVGDLVANLHVNLVDTGDIGAWGTDTAAAADGVQLVLARAARDLGGVVLTANDKTALALGTGVPAVTGAALAPLGDVLRSDLLAAAHVRNAISPVFPVLDVAPRDLPAPVRDGASAAREVLLGHVDDVIAAFVAGDIANLAHVDADVVDAVLAALRRAPLALAPLVPPLVMSSCTLFEAQLPSGFGWWPSLRPVDAGVATALTMGDPSREAGGPDMSGVCAPGDPDRPDERSMRGALRETLDLLRDLSDDSSLDWSAPFSDN